ncbi:hypothetical protein L1887_17496 [Cichorium endivia]|nr:hypothetical protein L1887_17496 [Cichorium endivia]
MYSFYIFIYILMNKAIIFLLFTFYDKSPQICTASGLGWLAPGPHKSCGPIASFSPSSKGLVLESNGSSSSGKKGDISTTLKVAYTL